MAESNIRVRKVCGKRGGRSFKEAIRPFLLDGACPEGFEACNPIFENNK